MAQVSEVIQADPWSFADALNTLAATNEIQIISKTYSSGKFLVVSDDAAPTGQTAEVITGDPTDLAAALNVIIGGGGNVEIVTPTFSSAHYVVVYS